MGETKHSKHRDGLRRHIIGNTIILCGLRTVLYIQYGKLFSIIQTRWQVTGGQIEKLDLEGGENY